MLSKKSREVSLISLPFLASYDEPVDIDADACIQDTSTTIMGINHIGISVANLDEMLAFYQAATRFKLLGIETIENNDDADILYGMSNVKLRKATLLAPNMLLELTEFDHNKGKETSLNPVQGPGMTHTCYQSPASEPGYNKFKDAGANILSRGDEPVDLGGYGLTYAYGYDPEGNMFEMEQADQALMDKSGYDPAFATLSNDKTLWMSQVALATHDIASLTAFFYKVLGIRPYRGGEYSNNVKMDAVTNQDGTHLRGTSFKMSKKAKIIELWQFINPLTPELTTPKAATEIGYSFSLEVGDIQREYQRLKGLGLTFISEPVLLGEFWQAHTRDVDGNVFALRQAKLKDSALSVQALDPKWNTE